MSLSISVYIWTSLVLWFLQLFIELNGPHPKHHRSRVITRTVLVAWTCLVLVTACGGGDDPDQTTQPVDCKAHPELCK